MLFLERGAQGLLADGMAGTLKTSEYPPRRKRDTEE